MSGPKLERDNAGKLPKDADGYPLIYYFEDGGVCCPDCANGENGSDATEDPEADAQWRLIGADVFWEGPDETCEHCGKAIESAYGDPDAVSR